jgi:O-antigen biosynthesis protein
MLFLHPYTSAIDALPLGTLKGVSPAGASDSSRKRWLSPEGPALFDLRPKAGAFPAGWVLFNGMLTRRGSDYTAKLYYDLGQGFCESQSIAPPISRRGTIHELIRLPKGIKALRWQAMNSPGEFEQSPLTMRKVCWIERMARMIRRVVPALHLHSRAKREKIGLTFWRMLYDLRGAYEATGKLRAYAPPVNYQAWIARFDALTERDRELIRAHIDRLTVRPVISVVMPVHNPREDFLRTAVESVRRQLYPHWELCIADDASTSPGTRRVLEEYQARDPRIKVCYRTENGHISEASNSALALAMGEFIALLDQDDVLAEQALYRVAVEFAEHPDAVLIYSDEDKIDEGRQRFDPYHKPDWNYQLLLSQNYISHLGVYRTEVVRGLGGFRRGFEGSQDYDLALRVVEQARPQDIRHIPAVLYHWRASGGSTAIAPEAKGYAWTAGQRALAGHLERTGVRATVEHSPVGSYFRVRYGLPRERPLVSIIIPTRDQADLLRECVESIRKRTRYSNWELVIVDNQSTDEKARRYLEQLAKSERVNVVRFDRPFNYSAINNFAVRHARGEVLCLLNNDTQVISQDWIEEMLGVLLQSGVGIVGARLWYEDDTLQHGGVIVGAGGTAAHAHAFLTRSDSGYFGRAHLAQEFSAVTGACLMVRKSLYEELGGLDEKNLAVAFNDVDFCLRAREAGWRIVWTPYAELYHYESKSRGAEDSGARKGLMRRESAYMRRRWVRVIQNDPYYNPNLSYERPDFVLSHAPMARCPWRE